VQSHWTANRAKGAYRIARSTGASASGFAGGLPSLSVTG
jgi:hypothetical protein